MQLFIKLNAKVDKMDVLTSKRALAKMGHEIAQIEEQLDKLEAQRTALFGQLESETLTQEQIDDIREFAKNIRGDIEIVGSDFAAKRNIVTMLDVQVRTTIENGQRIAYATCRLGSSIANCEVQHKCYTCVKYFYRTVTTQPSMD